MVWTKGKAWIRGKCKNCNRRFNRGELIFADIQGILLPSPNTMVLCENCFNQLHPNENVTDAKKLESKVLTKLEIAIIISGLGYFIFFWGMYLVSSSISILIIVIGLIIGFIGTYLIYRARKL